MVIQRKVIVLYVQCPALHASKKRYVPNPKMDENGQYRDYRETDVIYNHPIMDAFEHPIMDDSIIIQQWMILINFWMILCYSG